MEGMAGMMEGMFPPGTNPFSLLFRYEHGGYGGYDGGYVSAWY